MKQLIYIVLISTGTFLFAHQEQHITVIIPSYNNANYYKKNIESVLTQTFDNYDIIYIDDASSDRTGKLVESYIKKHNLYDKIHLIKNPYNRGALANLYKTIHMCKDDDLIVILDGDDWFAHNNALKLIHNLFKKRDIWLAYAQYINVPEHLAKKQKLSVIGGASPTPNHLIASNNYRKYPEWHWSGLRTFYAGLFKQIPFKDFVLPYAPYKGKFFPTSYDGAIIYPMLEMCGNHFAHIPEILLHRNIETPFNDFKVNRNLQRLCGKALRSFAPHPKLHTLPSKNEAATTELVILPDTQSNLDQAIHKTFPHTFIQKNIIYNKESRKLAHDLAKKHNFIIKPLMQPQTKLKHLQEICKNSTCSHILIAENNIASFSLSTALKLLGQLPADLLLWDSTLCDPMIPIQNQPFEHIEENIYALCTQYCPIKTMKNINGLYKREFLQKHLDKSTNMLELLNSIHNSLHTQNNAVLFIV